jgi:voltage-gated potassium channel
VPIFKFFILKLIRMNNFVLVAFALSLVVISSFVMTYLEPDTFTDPFVALWWVMTTLTTVGYGDLAPSTVPGRIYAIFLFLVGIGLIGVVIGKIIDSLDAFTRRREEGRMKFTGKDHIIMIGWGKKTEYALEELNHSEYAGDLVLVDILPKSPCSLDRLHYVQGAPADDATLLKANITRARSVIIFADPQIHDVSLVDGKTLLIATAVERLAPQVHTTVEIMDERNIQNFRHIQVNDFLLSGETISRLAVRSALSESHGRIISQLISRAHGDDLFEIQPVSRWKSYRDAYLELLEHGATLIADRGNMAINRNLDHSIPKDARLQIICDKSTYQSLLANFK